MKVLYLTKYARKGASSRLRSYQYFPYLEVHGIEITVSPFFDNQYLESLYTHQPTVRWALKAYIRRFFALIKVFEYDMIVIEKELFPYFPACGEWLLKLFKMKYIVDYDDAIFHNYDLNPNPLVRFFLKKKIDKVMKWSHCVIVGNEYLGRKAELSEAKRIEYIPTVIDLNRYKIKEEKLDNQPVIIGWIGTQSTLKYVNKIRQALNELIKQYDVHIHIIGASESLNLCKNEKHIEWSEETEVASIINCDIGIMPLSDTPWEKGKCAYKLIQFMGCGIPVVASPIGTNNDVIKDGYSGFLANTDEEWFQYIEKYILNPDLRKDHGSLGRKIVAEKYCLGAANPKIISVLNQE